jgi:hypothetical protein
MNLYNVTVPMFEKTLTNMEAWIDKTLEHAKTKKFEANDLLTTRLAPDMFPLVRQFRSVCDTAKFCCARVTGKEAPSHPDTETTWDELRPRMRAVREYIKGFKPADFEGAENRKISLPWMPGKMLTGQDYALDFALPNYNFHMVTAYAILRHNGVDLGKMDFLGSLPFQDA